MDDFWRLRARVPRSRGVLAAQPGAPSLEAGPPSGPPGAAPSGMPGGAPLPDAPHHDAPMSLVRLPPSDELADLVRHYWIPRWNLPAGRSVRQRVLEYPSANLVVEVDGVAVHGPSIGLGTRTLSGRGAAFGVLLQPGVASALLGVPARSLVGRAVAVPSFVQDDQPTGPRQRPDHGASASSSMPAAVRRALDAGRDVDAVLAFEAWFCALDIAVSDDAHLVRELVARAEDDRSLVRVEQLAALAGVGVRQLERVVREQLGLTPKWLLRRYRLQEAAERLAAPDRPTLAALATELGYADQAHLTREFSAVIGVPPGRYVREADLAGVQA